MRLVIRPIELLQAESAEAQARAVHGKRRCAIAPFANGGRYTKPSPRALRFESPQLHQVLFNFILYCSNITHELYFGAPTSALILSYDVVNLPDVLHFVQHLRFGAGS